MDPHGRKVLKELKESKVCEDNRLIKIDDCLGIEDLFSKTDFAKIVLGNPKAKIAKENSEFMKEEKISKVITARDFMINVNDEKIKITDISQITKDNIEKLLTKIIGTLKQNSGTPVLPVPVLESL